jgi:hypothetical protein
METRVKVDLVLWAGWTLLFSCMVWFLVVVIDNMTDEKHKLDLEFSFIALIGWTSLALVVVSTIVIRYHKYEYSFYYGLCVSGLGLCLALSVHFPKFSTGHRFWISGVFTLILFAKAILMIAKAKELVTEDVYKSLENPFKEDKGLDNL